MNNAAPQPDIRLVVTDMDGTLLDETGAVPAAFWPLLDAMLAAGIVFVPASGRQYQTLEAIFGQRDGLVYIAENGTNVVRAGVGIARETINPSAIAPAVEWVRETAASGSDIGIVVCGARTAYIERGDPDFVAHVRQYYAALEVVNNVMDAPLRDDILKLAIYDFGAAEKRTGPALRGLALDADLVISGQHWVDVMPVGVNKGRALVALQQQLGISRAQTMVFGDYFNDAEMLDAADLSYAMANAHPDIRARARFMAPANTEAGVVTAILAALPELASPAS